MGSVLNAGLGEEGREMIALGCMNVARATTSARFQSTGMVAMSLDGWFPCFRHITGATTTCGVSIETGIARKDTRKGNTIACSHSVMVRVLLPFFVVDRIRSKSITGYDVSYSSSSSRVQEAAG